MVMAEDLRIWFLVMVYSFWLFSDFNFWLQFMVYGSDFNFWLWFGLWFMIIAIWLYDM